MCICLCPSVCLFAEPQGTSAVWRNVPKGRTLLAAPPEGGNVEEGGWRRGNRGTFPVEMGLSLHQLLLQLQWEACRSMGTKPVGTQMGTHVQTCAHTEKSFLTHMSTHVRVSNIISLSVFFLCQDHTCEVTDCLGEGVIGVLTSCYDY